MKDNENIIIIINKNRNDSKQFIYFLAIWATMQKTLFSKENCVGIK